MTNEICECGHKEHWHQLVNQKVCLKCSCKKFKANNHSPQKLRPSIIANGSMSDEDTEPLVLNGIDSDVTSGSGDSLSDKRKEIREISVIAMSPSHIVEMVLDEVEKQDKEAVKKENALLSQLCAGVITWDEFHKERAEIFGSSLI